MEEKETMNLEYHPKQDVGHISFIWNKRIVAKPGWKKLGMFYGTLDEETEKK